MAMEETGEAFQEVCKEVTKAMEKNTKLKPVLGELEATLNSLRDDTVQGHQFDDESRTLERLVIKLRNGAKLIAKVSKLRAWHYFWDLDKYKEMVLEVLEFDESLRHLHYCMKKFRADKGRTVPLTEEEHLREEFVATHSAQRAFLRLKEDKKVPRKIRNLLDEIEKETVHCLEIMDLMTTEELRSLVEEMKKWVEVVWRSRCSKTKDQCIALERLLQCLHRRLP